MWKFPTQSWGLFRSCPKTPRKGFSYLQNTLNKARKYASTWQRFFPKECLQFFEENWFINEWASTIWEKMYLHSGLQNSLIPLTGAHGRLDIQRLLGHSAILTPSVQLATNQASSLLILPVHHGTQHPSRPGKCGTIITAPLVRLQS